jgi:hypothetical protein
MRDASLQPTVKRRAGQSTGSTKSSPAPRIATALSGSAAPCGRRRLLPSSGEQSGQDQGDTVTPRRSACARARNGPSRPAQAMASGCQDLAHLRRQQEAHLDQQRASITLGMGRQHPAEKSIRTPAGLSSCPSTIRFGGDPIGVAIPDRGGPGQRQHQRRAVAQARQIDGPPSPARAGASTATRPCRLDRASPWSRCWRAGDRHVATAAGSGRRRSARRWRRTPYASRRSGRSRHRLRQDEAAEEQEDDRSPKAPNISAAVPTPQTTASMARRRRDGIGIASVPADESPRMAATARRRAEGRNREQQQERERRADEE